MDGKAVIPPELSFAARWFSEYYETHRVEEVPGFRGREFGFMFFDRGYVHRHLGFQDRSELGRYLADRAPSHAYYSTAYYERPGARTMAEKGWLGADLIFDLDADHVKGSEGLPYEQMLLKVKEQMIRLYDGFVCSDLGFGEDETEIVFSGGRGYHIHVYAESVRKLGSHERREIVDYITAADIDLGLLLSTTVVREGTRGKLLRSTRLPLASDGGWYGKSRMAINRLLDDLGKMTREEAVDLLVAEGMKKSQANRTYSLLFEEGRKEIMLRDSILDSLTEKDDELKRFLLVLQKKTIELMSGQTDEPVTSDIHRLIRLPGSLHGKTSLRVVSLTRDELTGFDPLRDASADFPDETVRVYSTSSFTSEPVGGEAAAVKEGFNELPVRTALFLLLRRKVTLQPPARKADVQQS